MAATRCWIGNFPISHDPGSRPWTPGVCGGALSHGVRLCAERLRQAYEAAIAAGDSRP